MRLNSRKGIDELGAVLLDKKLRALLAVAVLARQRSAALAIGGGRVWIALADQNAVTSVLAR